jgi:predicted N-acyltransferase
MTRETSEPEERARQHMIAAYRAQQAPEGFDDWGKFTAHVVHAQRMEIERLRRLLREQGIEVGEWDDPLDRT